MPATNKSICKSRARHCNITYVQASATVRARRSIINFSSYLQQYIFKWVSPWARCREGQSMNSLPSQILKRRASFKKSSYSQRHFQLPKLGYAYTTTAARPESYGQYPRNTHQTNKNLDK